MSEVIYNTKELCKELGIAHADNENVNKMLINSMRKKNSRRYGKSKTKELLLWEEMISKTVNANIAMLLLFNEKLKGNPILKDLKYKHFI